TYTDIIGQYYATYTVVVEDAGKFIKVEAAGTEYYLGLVISEAVEIPRIPITAIGAISGSALVTEEQTAGLLTPSGATADYQWKICDTENGMYADIDGATTNTYTPIVADEGKYLKVVASGTGNYSGTVTSEAIQISRSPLTSISQIGGTPRVGEELTVGNLSPYGATADYQWTICDTIGGTYTEIDGATASTYTTVVADKGKYFKVVATGTGKNSGTVTSVAFGPLAQKLYVIGDTGPAGGLVFYDKGGVSNGWRYLEAAPSDIVLAGPASHHIFGYHQNESGVPIMVGTASTIGTGQANTTALVNAMGGAAYSSPSNSSLSTNPNYAARLCDILVIDTYEDWFLPSEDELNTLYTNLKLNGLGDLATDAYWSSSELTTYNAYHQNFGNWIDNNNDMRSQGKRVRAIRAF
ncbi:MAG: hypothetical protein Q8S19_07055, partial [Bacillota bacterium]|nr:hypothetical protein [Bacillota bacterium]